MTGDRNGLMGERDGPPLAGRVALVTGGGRGVGLGIARALAGAGMAVAVLARTTEQVEAAAAQIQADGGTALALTADVTVRADVEAAVADTERCLGPVDLLVNNAGIFGPIGPIWQVDPDEWWRGLESHLRGTLLCSRTVLAGMVARARGRVINVASRSGGAAQPYTSSYASAKAALIRFTDSLAAETAPHGISIFAIYPGIVRTRMTDELTDSEAGRRWLPDTEQERAGRWVTAERAGALCVVLAGGRADVLSGRFFGVDDDMAELIRHAEEIRQADLYTLRLRR